MKMMDIVAQKMPSENDVHVARSFLTKILRSSMRYDLVASLAFVLVSFFCCSLPSSLAYAHSHINHSCHDNIFILLVAACPVCGLPAPTGMEFDIHYIVEHALAISPWHAYMFCLYLKRNETAFMSAVYCFKICLSPHMPRRKNRFKGRNEPISRPHSWHAAKFNESHSETTKTQSPPASVWHTKYDASSSSTDLSTGWEQTNLRRVSDQFSSLGSMDSLEHASHPHPAGLLSPAKSNNSMEHLGGGKRDSAYSSFSTSSGTPDYTLSKSNAASTENVLYKVSQWDTGGKNGNVRNSQCLIEGTKQDDRPGHFHMPRGSARCSSPPTEDQAGSRHSTSSRSSFGPVWHVPEKKKTASSSPPPPLPPARSDSFAATKVHERGLIVAHAEGPDLHVSCKPSDKAKDNRVDDAKHITESCCIHNLSPKNSSDNFNTSPDNLNCNQFSSNKQYSFSSSDVRLGQPPHVTQPHHQKQHSHKGTVHSQPCAASGPKPQNISTYYCSMQELPTNGSAQFGHKRNLSTSQSTSATEQSAENSGHNQYYCGSAGQPTQPQSLSGKLDDRKNATGLDFVQTGSERNSSHQSVTKGKYQPQQQQNSSHSNGHSKQDESLHFKQPLTSTPPTLPDHSTTKSSSDERGSQKGQSSQNTETQYFSYLPIKQSEQRQSLPPQHKELLPDMRHQSQINSITPMLHSLSVDAAGQEEIMKHATSEDFLEGKQINRTERFATTLRNEIQIRRAKLQKSKSAATLPDVESKNEEEHGVWKSSECSTPASADGSFTHTYKDHLKEAQARVLKATSFKRKDLEPVLVEHSAAETIPNYPPLVLRKDITLLPTVSESGLSKSGTASGQVTRVGGRKRFSAEKKVKSFSEPDKIHEMGVKDASHNETTSSFVEEQQLLKETGKLEFPECMPIQSYTENCAQPKGQGLASTSETENTLKGIRSRAIPPPELTEKTEDPAHQHSVLGQQRLGTFAEYEARWSIPKKPPETKASGRYRSADNILDPRAEERAKSTCFHERSRSSPSADFYGQKVPVPGRKSEGEYSHTERKPVEQHSTATGFSNRGPSDCKLKEKPAEFDRYTAKTPPPATGPNLDCRDTAAANMDSVPPQPEDHAEPLPGRRKKPSAQEKSPPVRSSGISNSHTCFTSSQSEVVTSSHPDSTHIPTHSPTGDSEQGKELVDKGQEAVASYRASVRATMAGQRSPSPQFSPQRLSDKPPIAFPDENSSRIQNKIDQNAAVKKVPIRIVHSGGVPEKENCPFLQYSGSPVIDTERSGVTRISSLGATGQESVFCAFTRQKEPDATPAPQIEHNPETEVYTSPVTDHVGPKSSQQLTDEFSGYRGAPKTSLCDEDQKRDELARDIMGKDKSLADILDQSKMKTTMDLMEGIFPQGGQLLEGAQQRKKVSPKPPGSWCAEEREKEDSMAAAVTMVTSSAYYSTSAPKAELLNKMKDMQEQEEDSEDELDPDLANKKQELIESLSKKLQVLREARESLQEDILDNNALGDEVEAQVQQVCKPNELDKFRMFVGDLDKVVSLLLSLSGRLARVENALNSLEDDTTPEERRTLMEKRKLLIRQHEDAKELKENLDRRERLVYDILANYLQEDSLTDYEHFVKMKSALIIEQRKLEDKIKLGEEQLKCLMDSLPIEQRLCF
ncbi:protein Shroom2 isoform X1 [Thalassophryne amazonica]|uniref:protein Shroom2 isoform X1 n=1 Tax=Thalassophryne amazonica TaxID=390379 RepID=UPI0014709625|nr:protein Shroom2 isoform X1 [Thalassophryne amazonica]XP_034036477.1 protein Shroom2 isoform X1 [Thalassophryne amazonica]